MFKTCSILYHVADRKQDIHTVKSIAKAKWIKLIGIGNKQRHKYRENKNDDKVNHI